MQQHELQQPGSRENNSNVTKEPTTIKHRVQKQKLQEQKTKRTIIIPHQTECRAMQTDHNHPAQ
eukprot:EC722790.1.p3 GENE.EC722790.1~~EC722790.1.p3  ORF type:complete len:64 (-),score=1.85 EC722790.1:111-302(-)